MVLTLPTIVTQPPVASRIPRGHIGIVMVDGDGEMNSSGRGGGGGHGNRWRGDDGDGFGGGRGGRFSRRGDFEASASSLRALWSRSLRESDDDSFGGVLPYGGRGNGWDHHAPWC